MGFIFNNNDNGGVLPHIKLIIEDHDDSFVSGMIKGAFNQGDLAKMFDVQEVDKDQGHAYVEEDEAAALLIIPEGFADSLLAIGQTELVLLKNPSRDFGPKITEEVVVILAEAADRLVRIAEDPIRIVRGEIESDEQLSDQTTAAVAVMLNQLMNKTGNLIFDPPITLKKQTISTQEPQNNSKTMFAISLTGVATMSLFFILNGLAVDYFREREKYTLYRILISPMRPFAYLLSKQIYLFSAGLLSMLAVWLLGFTLWGIPIHWSQVGPFVLMLIATTAAAVGIISMLYSFMRTRGQASAVLPAVIIVFALLGGGMLPIQALPAFFRRLSAFSPIYWGVDGLQKILIDNMSLGAVSTHLLILAGLSILSVLVSFVLQRRRLAP
jgi:ABC-type multidrug transport system permease subunit